MIKIAICSALALALVGTAKAAPVEVVTKVMTEQRSTAPDGTTRVALTPAGRVTPGDKVVYKIAYRNTGKAPVSDFVLSNPLAKDLEYLAPANGSPAPEVSVDGTTFAPVSALKVSMAGGRVRPATAADVRVLRWRFAQPVAAGNGGEVSFQAVLR